MLGRLYRLVSGRADELLVAAAVLVGAALFYTPSVLPLLSSEGFLVQGAESTQARDTIRQDFAKNSPSMVVLLANKDNEVTSPAFKAAAQDITRQITAEPQVGNVVSYYDTGQDGFISKDKHTTYLLVSINGGPPAQREVASRLREHLKNDQLQLSYAGRSILGYDITKQINKDLATAEAISFSVLAVLLVIVFRGFVAAMLPLLLGGFTVLLAMLVLRGLVEVTTVVEYALNVIILIGLGLAVDYSLLMVSRFREELVAQKGDSGEALRITMHTAGRTIFFSGLTVIISLLSLLVFPLDFLRSMGLGGAAAVMVAMGGALVVLPAILHVLGRRVNWLSFGNARRMDKAATAGKKVKEKQSFWYKTGTFFMRWPVLTLLAVLVVLAVAVSPFMHAKLSNPDHTVLPPDSQSRQATERLQNDFNFTSSPIQVLYKPNGVITELQNVKALDDYKTTLAKTPGVTGVEVASAPVNNTVMLRVLYHGPATGEPAQELVRVIRGQNVPGVAISVAGDTAELVDLLGGLTKYIPYALAIIGVTLFVLLFLMLGSIVIPLKAILQNVLSLCASFGALVWIFQDGNLADFLHMNVAGSIDATQPVLIFAVAFGLSMDYSVFLYSRVKEEYDRTGNTDAAVLGGLQKTGGIITSAAVLLFVVVAAFATSRISIMQQIGVGLGLAILVDAFLIRMVLVPATMRLLGKYNWWAPKFLKRFYNRYAIRD